MDPAGFADVIGNFQMVGLEPGDRRRVAREHDHLRPLPVLPYFPDGGDAVHLRHFQVDNDDIRRILNQVIRRPRS